MLKLPSGAPKIVVKSTKNALYRGIRHEISCSQSRLSGGLCLGAMVKQSHVVLLNLHD